MSKSSISDEALGTFTEFCRILMVLLKKEKSGIACQLSFLGSVGDFPAPDNDMALSFSLADEKKSLWAARIGEFLKVGRTIRKELESLTGRLSFSKTAVFGRCGRGMMQPLYRKANAAYYQPEITNADRLVLEWWTAMLREAGPRRVVSHNPIPDKIVYTDAATETMIIASVVFE